MAEQVGYRQSVTIDDTTYSFALDVSGNSIERTTPSVAAAKAGTLTTRTDDNTGTLTMVGGHGITTAAKLDVFWVGGSRRNMTVGTVAGNSVPIDGGSGDNLPVAATDITAMIPTEVPFAVTGDNVDALAVHCQVNSWIVFQDAADADLAAFQIRADSGGAKVWANGDGNTNPLAGDTVDHVLFSHGDAVNARTMTAVVVF